MERLTQGVQAATREPGATGNQRALGGIAPLPASAARPRAADAAIGQLPP